MKFSQKAEEPTSAKAPENTLSIGELRVCFALVSIAALQQDVAVISNGKRKPLVSKYNF